MRSFLGNPEKNFSSERNIKLKAQTLAENVSYYLQSAQCEAVLFRKKYTRGTTNINSNLQCKSGH